MRHDRRRKRPISGKTTDVYGAALSRRGFVKLGGALTVGFGLVNSEGMAKDGAPANGNSLNAALPESWIEIHADNTILIRAGKPDFGQGTVFTAYRQIVADELRVPFEAITTWFPAIRIEPRMAAAHSISCKAECRIFGR